MAWQVPDPARVEKILGYSFSDPALLTQALTHSSLRAPDVPCNERMEFLGDSILGAIVARHLYERLPDHEEGELTRIKSTVVSRSTIGAVCRDLGLADHIGLGKGIASRKRLPLSIFANVYESLIAAISLDGGPEPARKFVLTTLAERIEALAGRRFRWNFKSRLQDYAQKRFASPPRYAVLAEEGPDHSKTFQVEAIVGGAHYPAAWGASKKDAEQRAARIALESLFAADGAEGELLELGEEADSGLELEADPAGAE
ncbi:MAG: ribonuclease III [Planctomycetes bacterium]|nr:ribonuclease III [Planctomycetota bacterium]